MDTCTSGLLGGGGRALDALCRRPVSELVPKFAPLISGGEIVTPCIFVQTILPADFLRSRERDR